MTKETLKINLHVYKSINYGFIHCVNRALIDDSDYILLANPVEVEVILKPKEELVAEEIKAIDKEIEKQMEEVLQRIEILKGKKADLLSLE